MAERRLDVDEARQESDEIIDLTDKDEKGHLVADSIEPTAEVVDDLHQDEYQVKPAALFPTTELTHLAKVMNIGVASNAEFQRVGEYKDKHVMSVAVACWERILKNESDRDHLLNDLANLRERYPELVERVVTREVYEQGRQLLRELYLQDKMDEVLDLRRSFQFSKAEIAEAVVSASLENVEQGSVRNGASLLARFSTSQEVIEALKQYPKSVEILEHALQEMKTRVQGEKDVNKGERLAMIAANLQMCLDSIINN